MIKPAIPVDESRRLETLRGLGLLDTPPEERFDRVTRLARKIFGTEIALVSLVDADRQWFKSRQGLDATETPRDISFCGHAILDHEIMVVTDASDDERFCDNPLVCGNPNIRFYAGYPISAPDSSRIGTLCVIDSQPRKISKEELGLLRELGRMVEEELVATSLRQTDPTTGLSNRLGFSLVAEHLLEFCRRNQKPASLLLLQFENLQEIDEQLGVTESERAVTEMGHLIMAGFRGCDIVARVAVDLFAVLLAGADLDGVDAARARFENLLSEGNREDDAMEMRTQYTAVAFHPGRHPNVESLLNDAEKNLLDKIVAEEEQIAAAES